MRPTRAALIVAATALTPALLLATPASATAAAAAPTSAPVTQATAGNDKPVDEMSEDDLRIAVLRILGGKNVGVGVTREANAALNGTPEELRAFLETGYRLARFEDDRVAVFTILGRKDTGPRVKEEINKLLNNNGSPEEFRAFHETGYRLARAEDDRVAIGKILAKPNISKALRKAAENALVDGTPEALRRFLEVGQYEVGGK
ncbi:ALF repeat-containing protein [Streptomyces rimosus]|uniref:ALF repeat-containing protein n=1 Tax=Streptomyces rimosus TaxID=1927 RepID=UPI0004C0406D|nr:ALF repeat-containing protein [Streptomyces rimosus]